LQCENPYDRRELIEKLESDKKNLSIINDEELQLIEVIDYFDVRWVLGV